MRVVRSLVAMVIWSADFALKLVLGAALIGIAWFCVAHPLGFSFGTVWTIASALSGLAIVGLFDGDDMILNSIAKRVADPPEKRKSNPMDRSGGSAAS